MSSRPVSEVVVTVGAMSTRTHTCVFFDEGELHVCGCGQTAMLVTEEDGTAVLVVLGAPDAFAHLPATPVPVSVVARPSTIDGALLVSA